MGVPMEVPGEPGGPPTVADGRRLHAAGAVAEAEAVYRAVLAETPDDPHALHLLGVVLHQRGRPADAVKFIRRAVTLSPDLSAAWQNLVLPLVDLGRFDEAAEAAATATRLAPTAIGGWINRVHALTAADRVGEAASAAECAVAIDPANAAAWAQLGHVRLRSGDPVAAELILRRALLIDADDRDALYNLGVVLHELGREPDAAMVYRRLLALDPDHAAARLNLGVSLRTLGDPRAALALWAGGTPAPGPELPYNVGCAHLILGDWAAGWAGYERRFEMPGHPRPPRLAGVPLWDGRSIPDGTLVVHFEQGLGDTLQFARLVPRLKGRAGRIVLAVQTALKPFLAMSPLFAGPDAPALVADHEPLPPADAYVPLLSLPHRLALTPETLRPSPPVFVADPERVARWRARLDALDAARGLSDKPFRVGLVWQGNPTAPAEKGRSMPLAALAPLARVAGVAVYALQKGVGREQMAGLPPDVTLVDLGPDFDAGPGAFLDTAAVANVLDLVITTDTSMAHVVGGLGRPVWTLLKHVPDWRWGLEGQISPFYPSMRQFRQPAVGDVAGLVTHLEHQLAALVDALPNAPDRTDPDASADPVPDLDVAIAAHAAGRHGEAIGLYKARLARHPDEGRTANLLAVAEFEAGGRSREAAAAALPLAWRSVALAPTDANGFANLGVILKNAGDAAEAERALETALAFDPAHGAALQTLVTLLGQRGAGVDAVDLTRAAARARPNDPAVRKAEALALKAAGRLAEAAEAFRVARALNPADVRLTVLYGNVLDESGDKDGAVRAWEEALVAEPDNVDALTNLGVAERRRGRGALAVWFYRRALELQPANADTLTNLGTALFELDRIVDARAAFKAAMVARPSHADAAMALGMTHLIEGDFEAGFKAYEARRRSARLALDDGLRLFEGREVAGRQLLVIGEQGFGDSIQFVRYAAALKAAGAARVTIACRPRLAALMASATGVDAVAVEGDTVPPSDGAVPIMSLPHLLGTRLDTIPAAIPYLTPDPVRVARFAERLAAGDGFRIGIAWQGNPDPTVDAGRSLPLKALAPLAAVKGVRLIALQQGDGAEQIAALGGAFAVETLGPDVDAGPDAFVDTAAVMMNLDLVVSTDTAVLHLAGALGRPAFAILKDRAEWRWLKERADSPWYPSLRLFRQGPTEVGTAAPWAGVVERLAGEVAALVGGDRSRLVPKTIDDRIPLPKAPPRPAGDARFSAAVTEHLAGRLDVAAAGYADVLLDHPEAVEAVHMLGAIALQRKTFPRALIHFEAARRRGLGTPEFRTNYAIALRRLGREGDAEALFRAIIAEAPGAGEALINLGALLVDSERPAEALPLLEQAVALRPGAAIAHRTLGNALRALARPAEALAPFDRAVDLAPADPELRIDRAHARLAAGDYPGGFADYEFRWSGSEMERRDLAAPLWDGGRFDERTLLVHGEQGLGDHIQFARFLPMVAARGGRLVVEVRRPLMRLLASLDFGGLPVTIVEQGAGPPPPHDMQAPLMSLPLLLGSTIDRLPAAVPYLRAEPERLVAWRHRLGLQGRPFVGLVWQGNPKARADKGRSPGLAAMTPLLAHLAERHPGVRVLALQKEHGLADLAALPEALRPMLPGPGFDAGPDAFLDSAALLSLADVVVSSDTALAHLAGALGRPTVLMLKHAPDWRWTAGRDDSPWYPTVRLVRQTVAGDWEGVTHKAAAALDAHFAARAGHGAPDAGPAARTEAAG
ncbi:tetratricopeptide repeat protein [Mongoliimonas terrestris]|uniref:tetratricopeptide repeat protein n=1 Tax=Mongoliimonas terrestris TaxID=1709001 RepID=UPI0009F8D3BB|nr:tetratricopeptide repeat protein [Mongoliimonas terrestris]